MFEAILCQVSVPISAGVVRLSVGDSCISLEQDCNNHASTKQNIDTLMAK